MERVMLDGAWRCIGEDAAGKGLECEAKVPGCVHTDLQRAGIVGDFYWRDEAGTVQWIEEKNWKYEKHFCLDEKHFSGQGSIYLCFEGLDTYCDIYLNQSYLGTCDNMFIPHEYEVTKLLKQGENVLEVLFHSPITAVAGKKPRRGAFTTERLYSRRIQCTYGWDWVERFVTCGIWKSVYLYEKRNSQIKDAYVYTEAIQQDYALLGVELQYQTPNEGALTSVTILDCDGKTVYRAKFFSREEKTYLQIGMENPKLWYPNGSGAQPLYTLSVETDNGSSLTVPFGIRTVLVEQKVDKEGSDNYRECLRLKTTESGKAYDFNEKFSGFQVKINGRHVFCRGANWVPCEPFPSEESEEKITGLLEMAVEAGVNMLRVWGGGIFENKHFYAECDRLGIMVTQDFLMACGSYPEEQDWFIEHVRKEAEHAAKYLRNHPSLVWWSGDNENAVNGSAAQVDYQGRKVFYKAILPALKKYDPRRLALASSPWGGDRYASKTVGTTHNTQFLSYLLAYFEEQDLSGYKEKYKDYLARFIAEEPSLGAVSKSSMLKMMTEEDLYAENMEMLAFHTKNNPGLKKTVFEYMTMFAEKVLGGFAGAEDRYFKLRYIQYEWIRLSMELYRRNRAFCGGVIYWMWNDCWPAASGWSIVDYYGLPKAAFYSFKRAVKPVMASIDYANGEYVLYVCNESGSEKKVDCRVSLVDGDGRTVTDITESCVRVSDGKTVTAVSDCSVRVPDGKSIQVLHIGEKDLISEKMAQAAILVGEISCEGYQDRCFYRQGILDIVPGAVAAEVSEEYVCVRSDEYIHAVALEGEAIFEDNYFSLMPGEEKVVRYRKAPEGAAGCEITVEAYKFRAV